MSFTFSGSFPAAVQWYPFAVAHQSHMAASGLATRVLTPHAGVVIHIRNNHIHIIAGAGGYEFALHLYGQSPAEQMNRRHFLDGVQAVSPFQDDLNVPFEPVQYNHVNMWLGNTSIMTGCSGPRYGAGVGWSTGNLSARLKPRFPRLIVDKTLLWEGDQEVIGAAVVHGVKTGIDINGVMHAWSGEDYYTSSHLPANTECYWVFNKAGTECSGIDYEFDVSGDDRVATRYTLYFSKNPDTQKIDYSYFSEVVYLGTYALDYDYTNDNDSLISCVFELYDRGLVKDLPDEFEDPYFMEAVDAVMVLKSSNRTARVPFVYNHRSGFDSAAVADPTDISYESRLVGMDLRFRAYCQASQGSVPFSSFNISTHVPNSQWEVSAVTDGKVLAAGAYLGGIVDSKGIQVQEREPGLTESLSTRFSAIYQLVRLCEAPSVKPDLTAMGFYVKGTKIFFGPNVDFLSSEGSNVFGDYHAKIRDNFLATDDSGYSGNDVLISTYSSWVGED